MNITNDHYKDSYISSLLPPAIITTKNKNASKICGDRDEVGSLASAGYEHQSTTDSVIAGKPTHGVTNIEDRKGSPN